MAAARRFFKKKIASNGIPAKVVVDKSGANLAGQQAIRIIVKFTGTGGMIEIRKFQYLHNILEQDHRFIKSLAISDICVTRSITLSGDKAIYNLLKTLRHNPIITRQVKNIPDKLSSI